MQKVLLTDHAWPDDSIERSVIEGAGFELFSGPANPAPVTEIDALCRQIKPDAILTCWAQVSSSAIEATANLKIVARLGVGLDNIAVATASERGIWVTNVPDYCVEEVSDHAVGMALAWTRGLVFFDRAVRQGHWEPSKAKLRRLSTLTCGIVGFGRIGRMTAKKLAGFGCRLMAYDPFPSAPTAGVEGVDLDTLFATSDIVIVHAPLNDKTHHLVNRERLGHMKQGGLLINVSRGGVVDSDAMVEALDLGILDAAAVDVLESEPLVPEGMIRHPRCIFTPHVAFSSDASLIDLRRRAAEEVVRVLKGEKPRNPVNKPAGR
ncbi:MAG: C-terminal binding protein [Pseudomonadota bacterium]